MSPCEKRTVEVLKSRNFEDIPHPLGAILPKSLASLLLGWRDRSLLSCQSMPKPATDRAEKLN
ncbi:hypothetical protein NIES593_14280 [Hydrococcus rivularis NIES-593]|uniref:Uncharacterized protein n=1 Tax=Hydrococcus rivularis NIES-593 TaxID=1921803 RepID=A0A1U7HE17_9CYAN|nr:hypothetical protein NIES593_14280 [Hydrococcus rivularis NIES-593]